MNSNNSWKKFQTNINNLPVYQKYREIIIFLLIGGFATLFDIVILVILKKTFPDDVIHPLGISISLDNCVSFTLSSIFNFIANKKINFKNTHERYLYQYLHFFIIGVVGLGINSVVFGFFHQTLNLGIVTSKIIAALVVVCWSFPANKLLTFGKKFSNE